VSAVAVAAPKRISGKLSRSGFDVIALAETGNAKSVRIRRDGSFSVVPPARNVTLHLRGVNGRYAGPIVIASARRGARAIVGVKAGARLGRIAARGRYARVSRTPLARFVDRTRFARARRGVPIGVGSFGFVRSRPSAGAVPGDFDLEGIPNALDVDDDGDLVLDELDRSLGARAAQAGGLNLSVHNQGGRYGLDRSVNANAAALTVESLDAAFSQSIGVMIPFMPGDSHELDCGPPVPIGLPYCAAGGTGRVVFGSLGGQSFPACCDADGDGFGTLTRNEFGFFVLGPGTTTGQISAGDVLVERVRSGGVENAYPDTLGLILATQSALVSYRDTAGNSATVGYPVPPGGPGTSGNGFPVAPGPDGNLVLTLTLWRPQRRPIPPETAEWMDLGGLLYSVGFGTTPEAPPAVQEGFKGCPQDAISTSDPDLASTQTPGGGFGGGRFADRAPDRPASAANTLTYTVNITQCMASIRENACRIYGVCGPFTWDPGQQRHLVFKSLVGSGGGSEQGVYFKRL
jgi:hypothetical protein